MAVATQHTTATTTSRWAGRPWWARTVRWGVAVVPFLAATMVSVVASLLLPAVSGWWLAAGRLLLVAAIATAVMRLVDRMMRRTLPLAALLDLSLTFPDRAPSRLKMAMRAASAQELGDLLDRYQRAGADDAAAAAERLLELVAALSRHDRITRGHSERVRAYAQMIGEEMGLSGDDLDRLRWAGLIHDIGKLRIDGEILNKPGRLTDEEFAVIKTHPALGAELAAPLADWLGESVLAVAQHHEKWDGTGYPNGISGYAISMPARIVAVADVFDVITSVRSYQQPRSAHEARAELARCAGTHFDPEVVRAFLSLSTSSLRRVMGPLSWATAWLVAARPVSAAPTNASGATGTGTSASATATTTATTTTTTTTATTATSTVASTGSSVSSAAASAASSAASATSSASFSGAISSAASSAFTAAASVSASATSATLATGVSAVVGIAATGLGTFVSLAPVVADAAPVAPSAAEVVSTTVAVESGAPVVVGAAVAADTGPVTVDGAASVSAESAALDSDSGTDGAPDDPNEVPEPAPVVAAVTGSTVISLPPTVPPTTTPARPVPLRPEPATVPPTTVPPTTVPPTTVPPTTVPPGDGRLSGVYLFGAPTAGDTKRPSHFVIEQRKPQHDTVPNFDADHDDLPGVSLSRREKDSDGSGDGSKADDDVVRFVLESREGVTIDGRLYTLLFARALPDDERSADEATGALQVSLMICDRKGVACKPIDRQRVDFESRADDRWPHSVGSGTFTKVGVDFGVQQLRLDPSLRFEVWVELAESSKFDVALALDTEFTQASLQVW
jgi:HD-GYP domain-containing protein (c-di-GMP phosphodiesterase class II)